MASHVLFSREKDFDLHAQILDVRDRGSGKIGLSAGAAGL
jgi:hypothetical protein